MLKMTKVKLKLILFVLSALLTDYIHARPFPDSLNTTNFDTISNYTYIPVDTDTDTLIVATEEEVRHADETNKSSKKQLDAMMKSEQNRDDNMYKKKKNEPAAELKLSKENAGEFHKQLNMSSPMLEEIFDAETGREETLTDILFKSETEFIEDAPRFEFLIGAKINETDGKRLSENSLDVGVNGSVFKKSDYVELVELGKLSTSDNKSAYFLNITVHEVDNDVAPDTSFTDVQTLFVACIGTLLPLLGVLCCTLFLRCIYRRWCRQCRKLSSITSASESSEKKESDHQQLKSVEESGSGGETNNDSPNETLPSNGSIITMTLKNNHLIVETEERNDITRNGRETKMKYSPDNDGIFVVEVQQAVSYRSNNKQIQNSPPHDPQISTNQALIHRVPEDLDIPDIKCLNNVTIPKPVPLALSNTGLSISDLSISSAGSHSISYSYTSQIGYEQGPFGYPIYPGYDIPKETTLNGRITHESSREPLICKTPTDPDKPVVTAAIFKQDSLIGNEALQGPGYCIEGSSDGPLLSDVQAREVSLQHLHDKMERKIENGVAIVMADKIESPKKQLNRADSLPVQFDDNNIPNEVTDKTVVLETITEDEMSPVNKDKLKSKRASLPIIRTELYESVKDAILPSGSPKFEKLTNDSSPIEIAMESSAGPMITITEEHETPGKSEGVSS